MLKNSKITITNFSMKILRKSRFASLSDDMPEIIPTVVEKKRGVRREEGAEGDRRGRRGGRRGGT